MKKLSQNTTWSEHSFCEKDIVYTAPGMRDYITVYEDGRKVRLRKLYLTMFLREAYSIFNAKFPDTVVSFSTFCKLKPKNVLSLKNTPLDQFRCQTHENFIFMLSALKIDYSDNFWQKCLCDSENIDSDCRFANQQVTCHLFVLDNYKKDKDAIFACLKKFYANTTTFSEEYIFSDGPSSEFKNKYTMKLIHHLTKEHSVTKFT